jgi:glycosyltransferase involved in cell wall biosynthesis
MDTHQSILLLVTQYELAGAQKIAHYLARYLHEKGQQVYLCFFYDKYGQLHKIRTEEEFSIIDLKAKVPNGSTFINGLRTVRSIFQLYALLRGEQIRVILTFTHFSNLLGTIAAWLARVPIRITSQRGALRHLPKWYLKLDSIIENSHLVNRIVAVSEDVKKFCIINENIDPQKISVIHNGVDPNKFDQGLWHDEEKQELRQQLAISKNFLVVTTIGRLHPIKGHKYLIDAAEMILDHFPQVKFLIIGTGEIKHIIQDRIMRSGLDEKISLLGTRSDIPFLLSISDIFVLPSLHEGMPNVVLEAMAAKIPVVATSVGGTNEIIIHNKTGLLVPHSDSSAITNAILELIVDRNKREEIGLNGYLHVKNHFSAERAYEKYFQLIQSLVKEGEILQ